MDYGDEWEEAWNSHLKAWHPANDAERYVSANDLNRNEKRLKIAAGKNPYPDNVELRCFVQFLTAEPELTSDIERKIQDYRKQKGGAWKLDEGEDISELQHLVIDTSQGTRPVEILQTKEMEDGHVLYRVLDLEEKGTYSGIPRLGFYFVDKPHTTDMFLENAFRREIGIPDELFPKLWKNILNSATPKGEEHHDEL